MRQLEHWLNEEQHALYYRQLHHRDSVLASTNHRITCCVPSGNPSQCAGFSNACLIHGVRDLNRVGEFKVHDPRIAYCVLYATFFDQLCTAGDLALAVGINKFRLHHRFKERVGLPLIRYMRIVKLQLAASQLIFTESNIIDIAFSIGYDSQEAFSRSFKRYFNITPGAYQKKFTRDIGQNSETVRRPDTRHIIVNRDIVLHPLFKRNNVGMFIRSETFRHCEECEACVILSQAPLGRLVVILSDCN